MLRRGSGSGSAGGDTDEGGTSLAGGATGSVAAGSSGGNSNGGGLLQLPGFDLRRHLDAHGIAAQFQGFSAPDDRGAGLLAAARASGADLLVMGAWGHSRLAELIVGGVTRHLFQHADRALFVAH